MVTNPLDGLLVDDNEVNRQLLYETLKGTIGIDKQTGDMRRLSDFYDLDEEEKVVVRLLYLQAAAHASYHDRNKPGESAKEIANALRMDKPDIKNILKSINDDLNFIEKKKDRGGYYIPGHRIGEAISYLR